MDDKKHPLEEIAEARDEAMRKTLIDLERNSQMPLIQTNTLHDEFARWGELDLDPLADLKVLQERMTTDCGYGTRDERIPLDPEGIADLCAKMEHALHMDGDFAFLIADGTFTVLEQHVLAGILHESGRITVDLDPPCGYLPGRNDLMIERHLARKAVANAKPPPSYLDHDPTKQHRRKRRGR